MAYGVVWRKLWRNAFGGNKQKAGGGMIPEGDDGIGRLVIYDDLEGSGGDDGDVRV